MSGKEPSFSIVDDSSDSCALRRPDRRRLWERATSILTFTLDERRRIARMFSVEDRLIGAVCGATGVFASAEVEARFIDAALALLNRRTAELLDEVLRDPAFNAKMRNRARYYRRYRRGRV